MIRTLFSSIPRVLMAGLLVAAAACAHAARIEGQAFDDRVHVAGSELQLNGLGLRAVAWIRGYAAGLYLAAKASTPAQVLATAGPKRIQLKMMLDVEAPEFIKAFDVGVRRNSSPAEQAALAERMAQFDRTIAAIGAVRKGDVIDLDFVPAQGLVLTINGKPRGQPIPGEDLYAGILKIFIGELPVDKKLKAGLLGAQPA